MMDAKENVFGYGSTHVVSDDLYNFIMGFKTDHDDTQFTGESKQDRWQVQVHSKQHILERKW